MKRFIVFRHRQEPEEMEFLKGPNLTGAYCYEPEFNAWYQVGDSQLRRFTHEDQVPAEHRTWALLLRGS